jgi:hypothetical protein
MVGDEFDYVGCTKAISVLSIREKSARGEVNRVALFKEKS